MTDWVPQTRTLVDTITPWPVRAMRGLLDQDPVAVEGEELPLGWHWLYFKEALRSSELGPDGHAARGSFLPPVELPRRMWAGGSLTSHRPLVIGEPAELRSRVSEVKEKEGGSGRLTFVTVGHEVFQRGELAVGEVQSLVFRGPQRSVGATHLPAPDRDDGVEWQESFTPTSVTLFQFSALTYNAHRIHYDHPYAADDEGYPGLLVHAPLTALVVLDAASRHRNGITGCRYRALAPLFVGGPIRVVGRGVSESGEASESGEGPGTPVEGETLVEAVSDSGTVAMRAWVD